MIVATQPETDCGTSLTDIWCQEFFEVLNDLEPVRATGGGDHPALGCGRVCFCARNKF